MTLQSDQKDMSKFCVGCGICLGICPVKAIKPQFHNGVLTVGFDYSRCTRCAACTEACPSLSNLNRTCPENSDGVGKIESILFGYAADNDVRLHAASGGVATSLILHMLRRRIVDKVLVVRMNKFTATSLLTSDPKDILSAQGSIYFKTFSLHLLPEISSYAKKGKRVCIVGLPCQISALGNILRDFRDRLYFLGLICNHVNEFWYLECLFERFLPNDAKPSIVTSRKHGWPGGIKIFFTPENQSTQEVSISQHDFWRPIPSLDISSPIGCSICADHLATMADIVVGDAWHPKFTAKSSSGVSILMVRTAKGLELVKSLVENKQLFVEKARMADLIVAQGTNIVEGSQYAPFKRKLVRHRISVFRDFKDIDKSIIAFLTVASYNMLKHRRIRHLLSRHLTERLLFVIEGFMLRCESTRLSRMTEDLTKSARARTRDS